MSKLRKFKNYVKENKNELLVCGLLGLATGYGIYHGHRIGYAQGVKNTSRIAGSIVKTYDVVKGTDLDIDLIKVARDNPEIFKQLLKG